MGEAPWRSTVAAVPSGVLSSIPSGPGASSIFSSATPAPTATAACGWRPGKARCSVTGRLQKLYAITADKAEAETIVIFAFVLDRRGLIWIGTDRGLVRLDPGSGSLRRYRHDHLDPRSLSNDRVNTVLEGPYGAIWAGTDDGLNLYDPRADRFAVYKSDGNDPASLVSDQVNFLAQDSQGRTWVCTSGGLDLMERQGEKIVFRHYRVPGGDPGQNLFRTLVRNAPPFLGKHQCRPGALRQRERHLHVL